MFKSGDTNTCNQVCKTRSHPLNLSAQIQLVSKRSFSLCSSTSLSTTGGTPTWSQSYQPALSRWSRTKFSRCSNDRFAPRPGSNVVTTWGRKSPTWQCWPRISPPKLLRSLRNKRRRTKKVRRMKLSCNLSYRLGLHQNLLNGCNLSSGLLFRQHVIMLAYAGVFVYLDNTCSQEDLPP